jgi:sarcosine oxidase gamma subunit
MNVDECKVLVQVAQCATSLFGMATVDILRTKNKQFEISISANHGTGNNR